MFCMRKRIELKSGDRYGRLVVVKEAASIVVSGETIRRVECVCDCGVVKEYRFQAIRSGNTRSCGCLVKDLPGCGGINKTHGMSYSSEYKIWSGMKRRCSDESFKHYFGRGIKVCDRWSSFEAFYEDMGPRPSSKHSIDRINNDGDYEPSNCRWATSKEQSRNKRVNHLIRHNGEVRCVADWADLYGVNQAILYHRLVKMGIPFEQAVVNAKLRFSRKTIRNQHPHYRVPMRDRDAAWQREHQKIEVYRIAKDRQDLEKFGVSIAESHMVDPKEFRSLVDSLLVESWTWKGAVLKTLKDLGAIE